MGTKRRDARKRVTKELDLSNPQELSKQDKRYLELVIRQHLVKKPIKSKRKRAIYKEGKLNKHKPRIKKRKASRTDNQKTRVYRVKDRKQKAVMVALSHTIHRSVTRGNEKVFYIMGKIIGKGGEGTVRASDYVIRLQGRKGIKIIAKPSVDKKQKFFVQKEKSRTLNEFKERVKQKEVLYNRYLMETDDPKFRKNYKGKGNGVIHIFMERKPGKPLSDSKAYIRTLSHNQRINLILSLFVDLRKLHYENVVHRDLKPDNIIIDPKTNKASLIDTDTSEKVNAADDEVECKFSRLYVAPEVLNMTLPEDKRIPDTLKERQINRVLTDCKTTKAIDIYALAPIIAIILGADEKISKNDEKLFAKKKPYARGPLDDNKKIALRDAVYNFNSIQVKDSKQKEKIINLLKKMSSLAPQDRPQSLQKVDEFFRKQHINENRLSKRKAPSRASTSGTKRVETKPGTSKRKGKEKRKGKIKDRLIGAAERVVPFRKGNKNNTEERVQPSTKKTKKSRGSKNQEAEKKQDQIYRKDLRLLFNALKQTIQQINPAEGTMTKSQREKLGEIKTKLTREKNEIDGLLEDNIILIQTQTYNKHYTDIRNLIHDETNASLLGERASILKKVLRVISKPGRVFLESCFGWKENPNGFWASESKKQFNKIRDELSSQVDNKVTNGASTSGFSERTPLLAKGIIQ